MNIERLKKEIAEVNCDNCAYRFSHSGRAHECRVLPPFQIPMRGCFCGDCKHGKCPLTKKEPDENTWCDQGLEYIDVTTETYRWNHCGAFKPVDMNNLNCGWHSVAIRRLKAQMDSMKTNKENQ